MASLSNLIQAATKADEAEDIAKSTQEQLDKESFLDNIVGVGKIGMGLGLKTLLAGSSPYLLPLLMGTGTQLGGGIFEGLLKGVGMGGDTSEIKGGHIYGQKEVARAREELQKKIDLGRHLTPENLATSVASSYLSALTPSINPKTGEITQTDLMKKASTDFGSWFGDSGGGGGIGGIGTGSIRTISPEFAQGGQVPKYKDGGTIADYFSNRGFSLGGSNKVSLRDSLKV